MAYNVGLGPILMAPFGTEYVVLMVIGGNVRVTMCITLYTGEQVHIMHIVAKPGFYTLCVCSAYFTFLFRSYSEHPHRFDVFEHPRFNFPGAFVIVAQVYPDNVPHSLRQMGLLCVMQYRLLQTSEFLPSSVLSDIFRARNINSIVNSVVPFDLCLCSRDRLCHL